MKNSRHGAGRVGGEVLQGRADGGRGGHDDGVFEGAVAPERLHDLGDGGGFLPDRRVDADDVLAFLVDDRVDGDGGLAGLAVTDDELALAAAYGDHRVEGENAGLEGHADRLARDDGRRAPLHQHHSLALDGAAAVQRDAERIHDPADEVRTRRNFRDAPGPAHGLALANLVLAGEEHAADIVFVQVERHADSARLELEELAVGA